MHLLDNENNSNKKCHCNWCDLAESDAWWQKGWPRMALPSACTMLASPAKAESVVDEINNAGGKAVAVQADVAKAADVEKPFQTDARSF